MSEGGSETVTVPPMGEVPALDVEVVTDEIEHGWDIGFLPDGGALVTERGGRLTHLSSTAPGAEVTRVDADLGEDVVGTALRGKRDGVRAGGDGIDAEHRRMRGDGDLVAAEHRDLDLGMVMADDDRGRGVVGRVAHRERDVRVGRVVEDDPFDEGELHESGERRHAIRI